MPDNPVDPYQIDRVSRLPGTVNYYNRHIIVCTGRSEWTAKIQDEGGFIKVLSSALSKETEQYTIKVTACDMKGEAVGETILVYPDQVQISGLREENLDNLMAYLSSGINSGLKIESFQKQLILVCGHHNRDVRCGLAAPGIIRKMDDFLEQNGLSEQVVISHSSHLGGHKFAGVAVVYPSGNWYGRLTEQDAFGIIKAECINHQPYSELWRGRMGLTAENQINSAEAAGWIVLDDTAKNDVSSR